MVNETLGVELEFVGESRATYADRRGALASLRLYSLDVGELRPGSDSGHEHWFVSDASMFSVAMIAYGPDSAVADFHDRLIVSGLRFEPLATYSHETR